MKPVKKNAKARGASELISPVTAAKYQSRNTLSVPREIVEDCKKRGLELRWGRISDFKESGYHKTDWVPYVRSKDAAPTIQEKLGGRNPDGFYVVKDAILMVKDAQDVKNYRAYVAQRTRQIADPVKTAARQIKQAFREAEMEDAFIEEGYDDKHGIGEAMGDESDE